MRIEEREGCGWGRGGTTGRGVISRDAITASLQQNRKRPLKWGRSQPAGLVLRPCPHSPPSLLPPLVSSGLRLSVCPLDGYVHTDATVKTPSTAPQSKPLPPQDSLMSRRMRVNLLILGFDYSSGSELRVSVRTPS